MESLTQERFVALPGLHQKLNTALAFFGHATVLLMNAGMGFLHIPAYDSKT